LRQRGAACAVINITRHRAADGDDVYYPRSAWQLVRLLLRLKYGVIHLHIGGNLTLRLLGLILFCTSLPRVTKVLTFHSGGYPSWPAGRNANRWTLRGFVFRRLDGVIGVNRELGAWLQRLGVAAGRIRVIPPHAVLRGNGEGPLSPVLQRFFEAHSPRLLSVGLLEPEYDLTLQIETLGKVREDFPAAGLILIGSGSMEASIKEAIQCKPYADHILLCGDVPHEMTLRAIARSDVLLRTTRYDGDSIAVREALHLGVPVIATDNGMRPAGVRVFPMADLDAVCRALESCLKEPAPARQPQPDAAGRENLDAVLRFYEDLAGTRTNREAAEK
jgi:glycosyltransferase involved in cell wall biosynthesis